MKLKKKIGNIVRIKSTESEDFDFNFSMQQYCEL